METEQIEVSPGGLTLLVTDSQHTASKHYRAEGCVKTRDYDLGWKFKPMPCEVANLAQLGELLTRIHRSDNIVLVRGALDAAYYAQAAIDPEYRILRRKNAKGDYPAHLREAARQYVMLDLDGVPLPPDADIEHDPQGIVRQVILDVLPPCFAGVECFYQWSSSAGFVPGIAKLHLWYWLSEPIENKELRRWFKHYAPHVDHAPFNAVQPHFVCNPVVDGDDPIQQRVGWLDGEHRPVILPPLCEPEKRSKRPPQTGRAATPGLHAASIEEALSRLGDGPDAAGDLLDGFHAPLLAGSMQYAYRCAKGGVRDDAALKARLCEAIEAAPKREGRDVSAYLDDAYLTRIIDGAFVLIANSRPPMDRATKWPLGFGMIDSGLWFTDPNKDDATPAWVCKPFRVIGECTDTASGNWGTVLSWPDRAGVEHVWIVPDEMLHGEPRDIAKHLAREGLKCSYAQHALLRRCLASLYPDHRLTTVQSAGWHGDSFVRPDGTVYGEAAIMLHPDLRRHDTSCAIAGTLEVWQREVAGYCVGNSRLALFTSAAFAGALLEPIAEPSGGLHLHAPSQTGKSTAVYVSGSVHGKGARGGNVYQWTATPNGLEAVAARYCDGCLILDEISQSDANLAGDTIYRLANENGKVRATQTGGYRPRANWRIMFLSTGEVTLAQRMSDAGKRVMTGMEIRLTNVPADAGCGLGVFETLHGFEHPAQLADHLRHASATYYGTAGQKFLECLAQTRREDAEAFVELLKAMRTKFIADYVPAGADGQVRSVAGRFGVVAAAGELAILWDILPWPEGEATKAAARCFADWLAARGTIGSGEKQMAIRQVQGFLEAHATTRFIEIQERFSGDTKWANKSSEPDDGEIGPLARVINQVGYRRYEAKEKRTLYMFTAEMWKQELCKGMDPDLVARAIDERGWLIRAVGHLTKKVRLPGEAKPRRMYVVSSAILADETPADDE